ncbi:hypothetical protein [Flavitalea sp.]|nr:hypothetical protein [Flavitalea sp.]
MNIPIEFYRILNSADPEFAQCMYIYHEAFPTYERQSDEMIMARVNKGSCLLLAGRAGGKIVCMSVLWDFQETDYMFLDYFAVADNATGYQVGARFLRFIINDFLEKGRFLVMEVEHPDYGINQEDRSRRIKFYEKNGGVVLKNVRYFLPPLGGSDTPLEMQLMLLPDPGRIIEEENIQPLITMIYSKVYLKKYETPT